MFEKKIVDGKVAVLYSPGFGAGWSTWFWENSKIQAFMTFDSVLVGLCLEGATEEQAHERLLEVFGEDARYTYTGGWRDTRVAWLDEGTDFLISGYDGSESIETRASQSWHKA